MDRGSRRSAPPWRACVLGRRGDARQHPAGRLGPAPEQLHLVIAHHLQRTEPGRRPHPPRLRGRRDDRPAGCLACSGEQPSRAAAAPPPGRPRASPGRRSRPAPSGRAAGGVVVGLLLSSVVLAVVLGAAAWARPDGGCVVDAGPPPAGGPSQPAELDPWSVPQPWRGLVSQAPDAQSRFDQAVDGWPAGPIKEPCGTSGRGCTRRWPRSAASPGVEPPCPGWSTGSHRPDTLGRTPWRGAAPDRGGAPQLPAPPRNAPRRWPAARRPSPPSSGPPGCPGTPQRRLLDRLRILVAHLDETVTSLCSWASTSRPPYHRPGALTRRHTRRSRPPLPPAWPTPPVRRSSPRTPTCELPPAVPPDPGGGAPGGDDPRGGDPGEQSSGA